MHGCALSQIFHSTNKHVVITYHVFWQLIFHSVNLQRYPWGNKKHKVEIRYYDGVDDNDDWSDSDCPSEEDCFDLSACIGEKLDEEIISEVKIITVIPTFMIVLEYVMDFLRSIYIMKMVMVMIWVLEAGKNFAVQMYQMAGY